MLLKNSVISFFISQNSIIKNSKKMRFFSIFFRFRGQRMVQFERRIRLKMEKEQNQEKETMYKAEKMFMYPATLDISSEVRPLCSVGEGEEEQVGIYQGRLEYTKVGLNYKRIVLKGVFATNSDFIIPKSIQPDAV